MPVTSDDEIGELAVSFNQMTNSLVQLEGMRKALSPMYRMT
ncbi:MAG: HAMP domain-containing protein [Oscillospiraceae bacterium]